jgi:glycosyltransferase involved in cell wall biosynthesis
MKIAMLGLKGLPAVHGGVERHVEQLGARLAAKGHRVTVYCRRAYTPAAGEYEGMQLALAPTIHTKHLDATIHTLTAGFAAAMSDADLVHYHAIGPGSMAFISRMFAKPVITTIHSLDFLRDKWSPPAKWALRMAEKATLAFANRTIVVSRQLANRYEGRRTPVTYIPNGVSPPNFCEPDEIAQKWGLAKGDYLLWTGRFSPEKGVHTLVDAFSRRDWPIKLVLAGGGNHTEKYVRELMVKIDKDDRIIAPGFVTGKVLDELYTNAAGFILPSLHEGLPVSMLEAMSFGLPCVTSDIPPCREIADGPPQAAIYFEPENTAALADQIERLLNDKTLGRQIGRQGQGVVLSDYNWDSIADQTEAQYEILLGGRK